MIKLIAIRLGTMKWRCRRLCFMTDIIRWGASGTASCRSIDGSERPVYRQSIASPATKSVLLNIQDVQLATEPGISLIILPLMRILQRNLKRTYPIVYETWKKRT